MTTQYPSLFNSRRACARASALVLVAAIVWPAHAQEQPKNDPVTINLNAIEQKKPVQFSPIPRMTSPVPDEPEPNPVKSPAAAAAVPKPKGTAQAIPRLKPAAPVVTQPAEVPAQPDAPVAAAAEVPAAAPAAEVLSQAPILPEEPAISAATAEKDKPIATVEGGTINQPQPIEAPGAAPTAPAAASDQSPAAAPPGTPSAQDTTTLAALAAELKPSGGLSPLGEALRGNSVVARMRFAPGSSELRADAKVTLDTLAERLLPLTMRMHLVALSGPKGDNSSGARRLSLIRALRVREYLTAKGIARTRVIVSAFGGAPDGNSDRVDLLIANDQVARVTGLSGATAVPGN